jgi:hypothetical protein
VITSFIASATEGEALAMQYLLGSIKAGEETFLDQIRQSAPQLANFIELTAEIRRGLPAEQVAEIMPGVTEALQGLAGTLKDPIFGGLRFEFSGAAPVQQSSTLPGFGSVPRDLLITAAKNLFNNGDQTREELVAQLGEEVVVAALGAAPASTQTTSASRSTSTEPEPEPIPLGGFNPDSVPVAVQSKARQLNILLTRQERANASGTTLRGVDQAIARLTREIRSGISLPDAKLALETVTLTEAEGGVPAGGIKLTSVPAFVRADVQRLNTLVKRRQGTTGRVARDLDGQIQVLRSRIQTAISER